VLAEGTNTDKHQNMRIGQNPVKIANVFLSTADKPVTVHIYGHENGEAIFIGGSAVF